MAITINGSGTITTFSASDIYADRIDSSSEGGQLTLRRSSDNGNMYAIDVYGSTTAPDFRILNTQASSTLLSLSSGGALTMSNNTFNLGTSSLGQNGYSRLPNGLLMQWGLSSSIATDSSLAITFPVTFTTLYGVLITGKQAINTTSQGSDTISVQSTSGFTIAHGADGAQTFYWMALGV